jgi:sulfonate transport system ATP-binding protein
MSVGVAVEAVGLRRAFGSKIVLNGFNLQVKPGEFVAVIGRSGSGKSTLLRLLAGLDRPEAGEVFLDGEKLSGLFASARIMFQEGRLLPWRSIGENVGLGLSKADRHLLSFWLSKVGLSDRIEDWPGMLSGGQKQRVALVRALAARPRLLLLDEPLGSLDSLTRLEMQRLIESLWLESGSSAVLITHDVEEAIVLADRIILLENGVSERQWDVTLTRPRKRATSEFVNLADSIRKILVNS